MDIKRSKNDIVFYKPNELIAVIGSQDINRTARHLLNYFLKFAQSKIKFNNYEGNVFSLEVDGVNDLAGIAGHDMMRMEKALDCLMLPVKIREKDNPRHYKAICLVPEIEVDFDKGLYNFKLADDVIELLKVSSYFTKINLVTLNNLKSKHSLVIFELLKRYMTLTKIPLFTIEELRKYTSTSDKKAYDNFSNFKKNVLDVAVEEINASTEFNVSYEKVCAEKRKRVSAIQFSFSRKKTSEIDNSLDVFCLPLVEHQSCDEAYTKLYDTFRKLSHGKIKLRDFCEYSYKYSLNTLQYLADKAQEKNWKTVELKWLDERETLHRKDEFLLERLTSGLEGQHLEFFKEKILYSYGFASVINRLKSALSASDIQEPIL